MQDKPRTFTTRRRVAGKEGYHSQEAAARAATHMHEQHPERGTRPHAAPVEPFCTASTSGLVSRPRVQLSLGGRGIIRGARAMLHSVICHGADRYHVGEEGGRRGCKTHWAPQTLRRNGRYT